MQFVKQFPEKSYFEMVQEIGSYNYQIFDKQESVPGNFTKELKIAKYNWVVAGTGATLSNYSFIEHGIDFTIPKGEQLIITRLLREDSASGELHFNADDYLIFPTKSGNIFRMKRNRAPDHFVQISNLAKIKTIADAYRLPKEKKGPIKNYFENGASLHIKLVEKPE